NPLPNIKAKDTTVCEGQVVALYGLGGISYTWNNGVVNGVSFIPTLGSTNYTVTGTDANGCVNTDNNVVTVNPFPDANVSASPISGYSPVITTFTNSSIGAGSYTWDFGDGQTASNNDLGGQQHAYSTIGEYAIVLTANNLGCLDTAMVIVTVLPYGPLEYNLPNVITPNGDGSNDIFHLRLRNAFALNLQIFNRWGNLMKTITNIEDDKGWNGQTEGGANADEGTYFYIYHITDMNGEMIDGHGFVQLIRK
ncbi:MAG: gliding motility-associated C-terminal domain-containing protein, partial [Crocinitomicaceae bacterium]